MPLQNIDLILNIRKCILKDPKCNIISEITGRKPHKILMILESHFLDGELIMIELKIGDCKSDEIIFDTNHNF